MYLYIWIRDLSRKFNSSAETFFKVILCLFCRYWRCPVLKLFMWSRTWKYHMQVKDRICLLIYLLLSSWTVSLLEFNLSDAHKFWDGWLLNYNQLGISIWHSSILLFICPPFEFCFVICYVCVVVLVIDDDLFCFSCFWAFCCVSVIRCPFFFPF